jgi:hypothetical protein
MPVPNDEHDEPVPMSLPLPGHIPRCEQENLAAPTSGHDSAAATTQGRKDRCSDVCVSLAMRVLSLLQCFPFPDCGNTPFS